MNFIKLGDPGYHQIKARLKGETYHGETSEVDQEAVEAFFQEGRYACPQKESHVGGAARGHKALK